jgi:hypothetical protein
VTVTFTGFQTASDVVIYQAGTETIRQTFDAYSGSSLGYTYETPETVDIGFFKAGFVPLYIRSLALGASDSSVPVSQVADRAYLT